MSSLVVGEEGWQPGVAPVELEEQGSVEQMAAPFPAFAEGWACCPGSTSPGSDGKCLQDNDMFFL